MIRRFKRAVLRYLASNSGYMIFGGRISRALGCISRSREFAKENYEEKPKIARDPQRYQVSQAVNDKVIYSMIVLNGYFKGMRYPEISALKSSQP